MSPRPARGRRVVDRLFVRGAVTQIEPVAARMRRIRLAGPELAAARLPRRAAYVLDLGLRSGSGDGRPLRARARRRSGRPMVQKPRGWSRCGLWGDRLPISRGEELSWLYREGRPAEQSATLLAAAQALKLPGTPGFLYLAGEAKTCAAIRRHFLDERGRPARTAMTVKPFWAPGKRGLE